MKILCVAHQRGEVVAAATALRGLPPEASVTWASSFKDAARWIRDNEDLAVLVLDAQVGSELCASFLKHLRGVGVTAPAIVVTSDGAADSVESLGFGPNDSVLTRGTLLHELPTALLCATGRIGPPLANSTRAFLASPEEVARSRDALEKRLQEAASALDAAEQRHAAETATAAARLADRQGRHDVELARIAVDRQALDQKLTWLDRALRRAEELRATEAVASTVLAQRAAELSASLEQARQERESTALAVERLARREAELAGALGVAASVRETLELKLADAESALARAESRATRERLAAAERQADLEQRLARAIDERGVVEARSASAEAAAERLAHREHELGAQIAEALAARNGLNRQLVDSQTALGTAQERAARERQDATEQAARREAELHEQISREIDQRRGIEEALARMERARQEAAAQQASVIASLTEQQARLETELGQAAAVRDALQQRLRDAEVTGERARQDQTTAAAEVERLLRLETELGTRLTEQQARFETELTEAAAAQDALQQRVRDAEVTGERARQDQATVAAEVERLLRLETELGARLAEAATASDMLARRLADAERARQDADEAATQERLAARERQTELEARVAQELDQRRAVETRLADAAIARLDAEQQHASEVSAAAARFAERHAQDEARLTAATAAAAEGLAHVEQELGARLADVTVARDELGRQLCDTKSTLEAAHEHAARERQAETEQALRRETELQELRKRLEEVTAAHKRLDQQLVHTKAALEAVHERTAREQQGAIAQHGSAIASLTAQLTADRARFETELTEAVVVRDALQQQLQDAEVIGERARQDQAIAAAETERLLRLEAELSARLADAERARQDVDEATTRERLAATERQTGIEARLAAELDQRRAVEERLADAAVARRDAEAQHASEMAIVVAQFAERCARLETELTETAAARELLGRQSTEQQGTLARAQQELQATAATLERLTQRESELNARVAEHASGATRLEALVAERDAQLTDRAARLSASEHALGQLQDTLRSAVAARAREVEQLQAELRAAAGELESTRSQRDVWHTEADQVPRLQKQLDDIRAEMHRQFDQHPLPMCQCTREGVLTRANRAFADLVGCPTADERRVLEVATTLFTASNDLSWLIERGLTPETEDSIEATWRNVQGGRQVVRLSAMATLDRILIVAQDVTQHHLLQDTLSRTRRMEAVGRLASEVAVTCGNLLGDVSRDGERWLATLDASAAHLHRGRSLLGDVARAASFLRQLDAYGEEQVGALEPVDLRRVLRDVEPVLKEVVGDDIELVLPKRSPRRAPAFYVDLKVERVERLLVIVASYARERMRLGGSVIFDLAPAQVDREFVDKYPSVRPGPHVLLTVTEARAVRSIGPIGLRQELVEANEGASPSERPGVDLGALHNLVRASGGHLWMEAEPPGDMVIKIHLPLREQDDRPWSATSLARAAMRVSGAGR